MSGRRGPNRIMKTIQSDVAAIGETITLDGLDVTLPHCFAGVQFFADANGNSPATPGAGTVTIAVRTVNTNPVFEAPPSPTIDATAPTTISWAGNTQAVRATPSGITTATHYRLVVTCNET